MSPVFPVTRVPTLNPRPSHQVHPYPANLIQTRVQAGVGTMTLRPILPEDESLLSELLDGLSPPARRNRFHGAMKVSQAKLRQMSCVDYQRQLAVVVTAQVNGAERLIADARYCVQDDGLCAEFALVVDERWQRRGLGAWAMQSLQQAAVGAGLEWLDGDVLQSNAPMLRLMQRCGFALCPDPEDGQIVKVQRRLDHQARPLPRASSGFRSWLQQAWRGPAPVAQVLPPTDMEGGLFGSLPALCTH